VTRAAGRGRPAASRGRLGAAGRGRPAAHSRDRLAATAAGFAAAAWSLPAAAPVVPGVARALRIPRRTAAPGTVALTFDDGPHAEGTPAALEALAAAGVTATFFLVGEQVARHGALAGEIAEAGHAVGVHGYRHHVLLRRRPAAVADDLDRAAETIVAATGVAPALHRPPLGIYSWPALRAVRARGWTPLLWSRWGHDWRRRATAASIAAEVAGELRSGDVLLLHDADRYSAPSCWRATAAALPRVLDAIAAAGLEATTLSAPADLAQGR
jgi:peptidoglycan-N-acetylglucosamine deacetylase